MYPQFLTTLSTNTKISSRSLSPSLPWYELVFESIWSNTNRSKLLRSNNFIHDFKIAAPAFSSEQRVVWFQRLRYKRAEGKPLTQVEKRRSAFIDSLFCSCDSTQTFSSLVEMLFGCELTRYGDYQLQSFSWESNLASLLSASLKFAQRNEDLATVFAVLNDVKDFEHVDPRIAFAIAQLTLRAVKLSQFQEKTLTIRRESVSFTVTLSSTACRCFEKIKHALPNGGKEIEQEIINIPMFPLPLDAKPTWFDPTKPYNVHHVNNDHHHHHQLKDEIVVLRFALVVVVVASALVISQLMMHLRNDPPPDETLEAQPPPIEIIETTPKSEIIEVVEEALSENSEKKQEEEEEEELKIDERRVILICYYILIFLGAMFF